MADITKEELSELTASLKEVVGEDELTSEAVDTLIRLR